jgi:glucose uptake protein GlcU
MNDIALGFLGVVIAVIFFGSNFLPLKGIKINDGVFFQFCMCNAVFMTSIPVLIFQGFPPVHGIALLGGFLWCTGNMLCPIAIRFIGMGLGLILWGCTSMILGWASGKFGLFGLAKQPISNPTMNYIGVVMSIIGLMLYVQVKTVDTSVDAQVFNAKNQKKKTDADIEDASYMSTGSEGNKLPLLDMDHIIDQNIDESDAATNLLHSRTAASGTHTECDTASRVTHTQEEGDSTDVSFGDNWSEEYKRSVGVVAALMAGALFGLCFDPSQYVIDNKYGGDDNSLNYVFSHYLGILLTSWTYTVIYCLYCQRNNKQPYVKSEIFLPATLSGIMWGVAQTAYFLANGKLGFPVAFPIISAGPGFVGAMYGVFVFKEITGKENLRMLCLAMLVTIPALALVGASH